MNNFAVIREEKQGSALVLTVDTKQATFRRMKWEQLGDWGKRKFENMLFLTRMNGDYVKVRYI